MTRVKQDLDQKKIQLAESIGEFIKYWGFKEIHGKIWVLVYLSGQPITAKEMTANLGVTKGLVSTALAEMIAYEVVEKVTLGDARSPGYRSKPDLVQVIYNILRNRELKLMTRIQEDISALSVEMQALEPEMFEKLTKLDEMTNFAADSLKKLLNNRVISTDRFKTIMRLIPRA